ncbi:uncharacterized protein METZ01_LOCUS476001, partial [marine metagenome]
MRSKHILYLVLFTILVGMNGLFANYAFKKKVKSVCQSYRITVDVSQFELGDDEFSMTLESGRNNFEMFMLVGFAAAGQAITHQIQMEKENTYTPAKVHLNVLVPSSRGEFNTFVASCP